MNASFQPPENQPWLADALQRVYRTPIDVPTELDQRMEQAAWAHFAAQRRRRLIFRRVLPWSAAAAVLVLVMSPLMFSSRERGVLAGDVNGDGVVDVVDALVLARRLEGNAKPPFGSEPQGRRQAAWDLNRDGLIDRADVDAVAMQAVVLTGPDGSNGGNRGNISTGAM